MTWKDDVAVSLLPLDAITRPDTLARPLPAAGARRSLPRLARHVPVLLPLVLVAGWAAADWQTVRDGAARIAGADPWWLLAGLLFTCLGWVAAACVRQGALPEKLPPGPLLASQFAAGAANHVLPASIGAHAVTLRFLQRQGVPLARATSSLALYSLVRPVAKVCVLVGFLVAFPGAAPGLGEFRFLPERRVLVLVLGGAGLGAVAVCLVLFAVRRLRRPVVGFLRTALADARRLHTMPARVLALWGGAALTPVQQGTVIACVGFSLGLPLSWAQVVLALLVASTAVGAVPAPGGIGPVDAALVFTMVAFGAPLTAATATVVGYRVLTVWVPLLPGALVLSLLVRRKVL